MLGRLCNWLNTVDCGDIVPFVVGWLNPVEVENNYPSQEYFRELLGKLEKYQSSASTLQPAYLRRSYSQRERVEKNRAYLEAAIFCVKAWMK
jgi:hypothetical protein